MRNHNEKTRDIARSVLPSTARKGARETRAAIHGRERAHERRLLHELRRCEDPDDYDGPLGLSHRYRRDIADMVAERREADKVGPLMQWADRTIATNPKLAALSGADREAHFRKILPPGLIGEHAISHLWFILDDDLAERISRLRRLSRPRRSSPDPTFVRRICDIVAVGAHGELNRRIRAAVPLVVVRTTSVPPRRLIDHDHPAPGIWIPGRTVIERVRRDVRFLAGEHDIDEFAAAATPAIKRIVEDLHASLAGDGTP